MPQLRRVILVAIPLLAACYHATIETGAKPSTTTVEKHWASGWIYGLVAPKTVETAAKCTTGVAKVETQLSFANQLVGFLTLGIFTPMDIRVTCAEPGSVQGALLTPSDTSEAALSAALLNARVEADSLHLPVYVLIRH